MLSFFKHSKETRLVPTTKSSSNDVAISQVNNQLIGSFVIPEPTRSLLFVTEEDLSKMQHWGTFTLNINKSVTNEGVKIEVNSPENGFYAEPSLIWTKLPVQTTEEHVTEPMYYPSYSKFYPKTRYEYLRWLGDITQPTNLSYVFLYFYGLERQLLIGNYDGAVDEILRLLEHHKQDSFQNYASRSLIVASIYHNRLDIIKRAPFLLDMDIDEALALRIQEGMSLSPEEMMKLASWVGFANRRYIKLQPKLFKQELQKLIDEFEAKHGKLLSVFKLQDFKMENSTVFANMSIPDRFRQVKVPIILRDSHFQEGIKTLLEQAHANVKAKLATRRKKVQD